MSGRRTARHDRGDAGGWPEAILFVVVVATVVVSAIVAF